MPKPIDISEPKKLPEFTVTPIADRYAVDTIVTITYTLEELEYRRIIILKELAAINAILHPGG
jgi:hypothetical protein